MPEQYDAYLYGAGSVKIGSIVLPDGTPDEQKSRGDSLKRKFLNNTPALKRLQEDVKKAAKRGWLRGLDGRRVYVRSQHAALNTLLQSAGAIICKLWVTQIDKLMQEWGYRHGWDGSYAYSAFVHDEIQIAFKGEEVGEALGRAAKQAIKDVEEVVAFRCPLDCDFSIGNNWSETH